MNPERHINKKAQRRYRCSLYDIATRLVLRHRLKAKNIKTINVKRPTIRAATPYNDKRGFYHSVFDIDPRPSQMSGINLAL